MERMEQEYDEISLKELIEVIWNRKIFIAIVTVIFAIFAFIGGTVYNNLESEVGTIVTMQWNGVSSGEYPDGTRFDYSEAIEPYVITLAIEEVGMELTTNDVRNNLTIQPIVPGNVLASIQKSIEEGGEPITYYASNYKLLLNNGNLTISVEQARILLNEIIDQFRIDFERKYINQATVYNFTNQDIDSYDYLEAYDILDTQATLITNAMNAREDSGFTSPTLGITFGDLVVRTNLVERIELNQVVSRVNSYLLTKDVDFLITNYNYKIETLQLELDKAILKEADAQVMIDNYQGSTQTILIPGMSDTDSLEFDTYYNTLLETQISLQQQIADLTEDIAYYELQIDRLNGDDPNFVVTEAKQAEEAQKVEENLQLADDKLSLIVNDANIILAEYNEYLTSNIIKPLMAPEYQPSANVLLYTAIGLVLGGMVGVGAVLGKHFWNQAE